MIWLLAVLDAAAGLYLLGWALRREWRDKPGVLAVGVVLLLSAVLLGGLGVVPSQVRQAARAETLLNDGGHSALPAPDDATVAYCLRS